MTAVDKLLGIAAAEVGYLEKASNADLDDKTANAGNKNYTKYARDLDAIKGFYNGRKQGSSWCDVFVDWLFVMAFGVEPALKLLCQTMGGCGAGVKYSAEYFRAKGRFFERDPHPGDQMFFVRRNKAGEITAWLHTCIVEKVVGNYVYTIEGNTSGASGVVSNGGGVCRKKYRLNSASIGGYGRPDWSLVKEENEMSEKEINELVDKRVEEAVAAAIEPLNKTITKLVKGVFPHTYTKEKNLPSWAQAAVQKLRWAGVIKGDGENEVSLIDGVMNLGTAVAMSRVLDKTSPKVFKNIGDVPEFWRKEIAALEAAGALKGDSTGAVNLTETEAKVLAVVARLEGLVETADK